MEKRVILYTQHCPLCVQLERQLKMKNVHYEECEDVQPLIDRGYRTLPMLEVSLIEDGTTVDSELMDFRAAINWLKTEA